MTSDLQEFYDVHGERTPLVEDLVAIQKDGEYRRTKVIERIAAPQPGERILDVGCGDGFLMAHLSRENARLVGLELAEPRLAQARNRLQGLGIDAELVRGSADLLPFPDESFDLVTCSEVLEHLPQPGAAIREAFRVLRRGGRFVASVPHREHIPFHKCMHCGEMTSLSPSGHLHSFDAERVRGLLDDEGFVVDEVRGTYPRANRRRGIVGIALRALPFQVWYDIDEWTIRKKGGGNWLVARAHRP